MSTQTSRHHWVDIAKAISIVLVVMMHATYGVGEATGEVGFMHYILAFATPFRMPEFFLISGLFLGLVIARPWRHFADRRVIHYLYFYALWAVILIAFKHLLVDRDPAGTLAMLGTALYEPYSVLWFIYALALFSLLAKIAYTIKLPHMPVLVIAAALSIAPIETGIYVLDFTAAYFVYFYAGYALAPQIFAFADTVAARPVLALVGLLVWAGFNTALVFAPGHVVAPGFVITGIADIPGMTLVLAALGSLAICTLSVLLTRHSQMNWLAWVGAHSIVIYLSFTLPMGIFRTLLLAVMPGIDTGLASLLVLIVAVISPIIVYWVIGRIGFGHFLFARPSWAQLPGAPGSRWGKQPAPAPAE